MEKMKSFSYTIILFLLVQFIIPVSNAQDKSSFSFAFMTDIHLQYERGAVEGLNKAIDNVNTLKPDFVITGGDLIMDALGQTYDYADSLYNLYEGEMKKFDMPVYNTMGNHEIFGIYDATFSNASHPEYNEKMFEKRLGDTYYSFDHKGWKFFVINSIEDTKKNRYIGLVDSTQMEWIKNELKHTDASTPLVLSTHIPFITTFSQIYESSITPNDSGLVVINSREVLDLFQNHNLKLVLQGHLHTVEDIYVNGTHFITGGAVSARWWRGPYRKFEEGYLMIHISGQDFKWEYIDYQWDASSYQDD